MDSPRLLFNSCNQLAQISYLWFFFILKSLLFEIKARSVLNWLVVLLSGHIFVRKTHLPWLLDIAIFEPQRTPHMGWLCRAAFPGCPGYPLTVLPSNGFPGLITYLIVYPSLGGYTLAFFRFPYLWHDIKPPWLAWPPSVTL